MREARGKREGSFPTCRDSSAVRIHMRNGKRQKRRTMITCKCRDAIGAGQMTNREYDQDRKNQAYELRLGGKTYREIGRILGIGHGTAERWCKEHMESVSLPLIEEVRKQELDRLMRILDRLEERAVEGDDKALGLMLKTSESLRKLLGADMPVVTVTEKREVSQMDLDIRRLIDAQNAQNAEALRMAAEKEVQ